MYGKWQNYYRTLKLKEKVRILFLVLTFVYLTLILFFMFLFVLDSSTTYLKGNNKTMMESSAENLNVTFQTISNMSLLIMNNKNVQQYLVSGEEKSLADAIFDMKQTSAFFSNIDSIFLIRNNNDYISVGRGTDVEEVVLKQEFWKKEIDEREGGYVVKLNGNDIFSMSTGEKVISFIRRVNHPESQKPIGYLVVNIPITVLEEAEIYSEEGKQIYGFEDSDGRAIGEVQPEKRDWREESFSLQQKIVQGIDTIQIKSGILCAKNSICIWMVQEVSMLSLLRGQINFVWIIFMIVTIIAFFLIGVFITKNVTNPIEKLCKSMEGVKTGYFYRVSMQIPNDEIGVLKDTYNNMLVETNRLIAQLVEQEKKMKYAELKILQEQIKPHFLYNTLNMIGYMALEAPRENIYDAVETLGNFYRKFLSRGKTSISLKEEIGIVRDYLTLQKLRYEDVFEDQYEIPETMSDIRVPKLILQPFVENSIYHGVRLKGEKGMIKTKVVEETDFIEITIWDNGVGATNEEIERCFQKESDRSFGMKGTVERLKHYYQKEDVCTIQSKKGEFFEVKLTLPKTVLDHQ